MQLGRLPWAILAGVLAITAVFAVRMVAEGVFDFVVGRRALSATFLGVGGAVLWLADHFDLMRSAYAEPALGLHDHAPTEPSTKGNAGDDSDSSL